MDLPRVTKQVLANGLTVLIMPCRAIPKVSTQLWYNAGSKDEKSGEKGIAHLIEHMIFKGTDVLSECDINLITHKLSGYCNAFTSYDYTGYLFDFPSQHWHEALPVMADCMRNCTFKEDFLNSELKAVIQELKMYKDDYGSSIIESLTSAIFSDHPYHHPVIGYKQDLWNLDRNSLVNFYRYHYCPNNATLVIVGDVEIEKALDLIHKSFGNIKPNLNYKKSDFYHSPDLKTHSVSIYRDIQQPLVILSWVIPGARTGNQYLLEVISWILGSGRGSRLYKKIIDELELATEIDMFTYDLFDNGLFFIYFRPKSASDIASIINVICDELDNISNNGVKENEIVRAIKKTEVEYLSTLEDNQKQAYAIGQYYLATGDENFLYTYTNYPKDNLLHEVQDFIKKYLKPTLMNQGNVLPLQENDKKYWLELQEISDQEDARILSLKSREVEVEEGKCVHSIEIHKPKQFDFPQAQSIHLTNRLKVLSFNNSNLPKIDLIVDLKSKNYYDPENLMGLGSFVADLLQEGTENLSAQDFADTLESQGMSLSTSAGYIYMSMLSSDLHKGLDLLSQILTHASFKAQAVQKVRSQMIADLKQYWDEPSKFIVQLAKDAVYKNHPYSKNSLGTLESLEKITQNDLINYYKNNYTPQGARMAIVGNLERYDVREMLEHMLYSWTGPEVPDLDYPSLSFTNQEEINYKIMRDQVALCYSGISVSRNDPDYDKLLLFDQIFTGGVLGSMSSRLFDLRERSGLFYTIGGSLIARVDKQPGMIYIRTIVSNDRLSEAEKAIENVIDTAINTITREEFEEAKRAITNSLVDNFATNYKLASSFIFRDTFNLPADYFVNRINQLSQITIEQMQEIVRKYLNTKHMVKIRAGRI